MTITYVPPQHVIDQMIDDTQAFIDLLLTPGTSRPAIGIAKRRLASQLTGAPAEVVDGLTVAACAFREFNGMPAHPYGSKGDDAIIKAARAYIDSERSHSNRDHVVALRDALVSLLLGMNWEYFRTITQKQENGSSYAVELMENFDEGAYLASRKQLTAPNGRYRRVLN
jgi:hypothetical protein